MLKVMGKCSSRRLFRYGAIVTVVITFELLVPLVLVLCCLRLHIACSVC